MCHRDARPLAPILVELTGNGQIQGRGVRSPSSSQAHRKPIRVNCLPSRRTYALCGRMANPSGNATGDGVQRGRTSATWSASYTNRVFGAIGVFPADARPYPGLRPVDSKPHLGQRGYPINSAEVLDMISQNLLLTAAKRLQWISEELPPSGPQDVLVQTRTGAISIGSELPLYRGVARANHPAYYPRMTGYESVGTVLACGSDVKSIRPGERVVAFYGHRTHAIVHASKVIVVPDDISDALAILTILSCDAARGVRKLSPLPEERSLITGAGAMGLLTLFILKAYG